MLRIERANKYKIFMEVMRIERANKWLGLKTQSAGLCDLEKLLLSQRMYTQIYTKVQGLLEEEVGAAQRSPQVETRKGVDLIRLLARPTTTRTGRRGNLSFRRRSSTTGGKGRNSIVWKAGRFQTINVDLLQVRADSDLEKILVSSFYAERAGVERGEGRLGEGVGPDVDEGGRLEGRLKRRSSRPVMSRWERWSTRKMAVDNSSESCVM